LPACQITPRHTSGYRDAVLVMTRFRSDGDLGDTLEAVAALLSGCSGCLDTAVGRNLDEPGLWLLSSRWADVGSYRRALSSYDVKLALAPLMTAILDEPSAYEQRDREGAAVWNANIPR